MHCCTWQFLQAVLAGHVSTEHFLGPFLVWIPMNSCQASLHSPIYASEELLQLLITNTFDCDRLEKRFIINPKTVYTQTVDISKIYTLQSFICIYIVNIYWV